MKCVLIDDEPKALEILRRHVEKTQYLELVGSFRDAMRALEYMAANPVDLVFLDVNMPDMSGIQFLNALHTRPLVIFTTAYSDYAVRSYEYDAVDYLLKPIEFERFARAAAKALQLHRQREGSGHPVAVADGPERYLVIKSGTDYHKLQFDEILYIEAAGNYAVFVTPSTRVMSLQSMKDLGSMLPAASFFRVHKSYIVNFRHVSRIEKRQVMVGPRAIPIGESFRENFLQAVDRMKL